MRQCGSSTTPRPVSGHLTPARAPHLWPGHHTSAQHLRPGRHTPQAPGHVKRFTSTHSSDRISGTCGIQATARGRHRCARATPNQSRIGPLEAAGPPPQPPSPQCVYAPTVLVPEHWRLWKTLWNAVENSGCVHRRQCRGSGQDSDSVATDSGAGDGLRCARPGSWGVAFAPQLRGGFGLGTIRCVTGEGGGGVRATLSARRRTQSWRIDLCRTPRGINECLTTQRSLSWRV